MIKKINNVSISYNKNEIKEIDKIFPLLEKYSFLFINDTDITIQFKDLNEFLKRKITNIAVYNMPDTNKNHYLAYILLSLNFDTKDEYFKQVGTSEETLYLILSIYYYNYNINKIIKFIYNDDDNEKSKILKSFREENRLEIVNYILENSYEQFDLLGYSSVLKLNDLISLLNKENDNNFLGYVLDPKSKQFFDEQEFDINELEKLFEKFLTYINAPIEWINEFKYLRENDLIDYNSDSSYFNIQNGKRTVHISLSNFASTFIAFVHEFIHDITDINGLSQVNISEFPSIYFEKLAAKFLLTQNYDEEYINSIMKFRKNNNVQICMSYVPILTQLSYYVENGPLTKEYLLESQQKTQSEFLRKKMEVINTLKEMGYDYHKLENARDEYDPEETYKDTLDNIIDIYIMNCTILFRGVGYVVNNLIVEELLKREDSENVLSDMIDVTNNLSEYDLKSLLEHFNIKLFNKHEIPLKLRKINIKRGTIKK